MGLLFTAEITELAVICDVGYASQDVHVFNAIENSSSLVVNRC